MTTSETSARPASAVAPAPAGLAVGTAALAEASRSALCGAALSVLVVIAYVRFLDAGFAGTDSLPLIDTSRVLSRSDLLQQLRQPVMAGTVFTSGELIYRPVVSLTFALDYALWGLNAVGYHLTNIVFHVLTTLGVFGIARSLGLSRRSSVLGAAVFALHPTVVAAVPVIARRDNLVSAAPFCLALVCLSQSLRGRSKVWTVLGAVLFALALLSKEMAFGGAPLIAVFALGVLALRADRPAQGSAPVPPHGSPSPLMTRDVPPQGWLSQRMRRRVLRQGWPSQLLARGVLRRGSPAQLITRGVLGQGWPAQHITRGGLAPFGRVCLAPLGRVCLVFGATAVAMFVLRFAVLGTIGGYAGTALGQPNGQLYRHILVTFARFLFWPLRDVFAAGSIGWLLGPAVLVVVLLVVSARMPRRTGVPLAIGCLWLADFALFYTLLKTFTGAWYLYFALPGAALVVAALLEWSVSVWRGAVPAVGWSVSGRPGTVRPAVAPSAIGPINAPCAARPGVALSAVRPAAAPSATTHFALRPPATRGFARADRAARLPVAFALALPALATAAVVWTSSLVQPYAVWLIDGAASARYLGAVVDCARGAADGSILTFAQVPDYLDYPDNVQVELLTPTLVYEHTLTSVLRLALPGRAFELQVEGYNHLRTPDHLAVSCDATPTGRRMVASS